MAGEPSQMLPPSVLRQTTVVLCPGDINGCRCRKTKCDNSICPCCKERYRCTSKCVCQECENPNGVRGSDDSNTEPGLNKLPSSNNETRQQGARLEGLPVPEDFNGCKCPGRRCTDGRCACVRETYRCTSRCKCENCDNRYGRRGDPEPASDRNNELEQAGDTRGSEDLNTEQGQGGTGGTSNAPGDAVLTTASSNTEAEQADDASSVDREPPAQPAVQRAFDLNELP